MDEQPDESASTATVSKPEAPVSLGIVAGLALASLSSGAAALVWVDATATAHTGNESLFFLGLSLVVGGWLAGNVVVATWLVLRWRGRRASAGRLQLRLLALLVALADAVALYVVVDKIFD